MHTLNLLNFRLLWLLLLWSQLSFGQLPRKGIDRKKSTLMALKACLPARITPTRTIICPGETIELRSNILPEYRYRWFLEGVPIVGETTYLLVVDLPGLYQLEVTNTRLADCVQTTELRIGQSSLKSLSVLPLSGTVACTGSSLVAAISAVSGTTIDDSTSLRYAWLRDGLRLAATGPVLPVGTPGRYSVSVSDGDCIVDADPLTVFPSPEPVLNNVPDQCEKTAAPFRLTATPAGGVFSGKGVQDVLFDPARAGGGAHTLTYSLTSAAGCVAEASQLVRVIRVPLPDLGPSQTIITGTRLVMQGPAGAPTDPPLTYTWEPINGLIISETVTTGGYLNAARVVAQPTETTTYRLTVSANSQCPISSELLVTVLPGLFIPTAFTPNNDGQNDTWMLTGIEAFPACSVRIYNRWGELLLNQSPYTQPWDGRVRGELVAPGPYRYVISPAPFLPERAGTLVLLH